VDLETLEEIARHLYDRLLGRWTSTKPDRARWLKGATYHALLEHCPEACLQFQVEDVITIHFEDAIWERLRGFWQIKCLVTHITLY